MHSPIRGYYVPLLWTALFSLIPDILVAGGTFVYEQELIKELHATQTALGIVEGLNIAGYAFGAMLGGDLINRVVQRNLFLAAEGLLTLGWILSAVAGNIDLYGTGQVLAGISTGMLLVVALPPVIRRFPPSRLVLTTTFTDIAFFGAVSGGPLLGAIVAASHMWRELYIGFAGLGGFTALVAVLSLPKIDPPNPDLPFDYIGIALAFAATVLPFWASGELESNHFASFAVAVPLAVGLACFLAMMLVEYHQQEPLAPIKKMWIAIPVIGTLIAMFGGGVFYAYVDLTIEYLLKVQQLTPFVAGITFWPQLIGTIVAAILLGALFPTRYLILLAYAGMLVLTAGGAILLAFNGHHARILLLAGIGVLGLGAGATVAPGLFMAGLPLPAQMLGRVFALIELVRSVADFLLAPVIVRIGRNLSSPGGKLDFNGYHAAIWITLWIGVGGLILVLFLHVASRVRLHRPDLEGWLKQNRTAVASPPLLRALRRLPP